MYLHEAMCEVLRKRPGCRAHRAEVADAINRLRLYSRRDGEPLPPSQVSARAGKYPRLFKTLGNGIIGLR